MNTKTIIDTIDQMLNQSFTAGWDRPTHAILGKNVLKRLTDELGGISCLEITHVCGLEVDYDTPVDDDMIALHSGCAEPESRPMPPESAKFLEEFEQRLDKLRERFPDADYGPGHIVFSDGNFEDGNIHFCLEEMKVPKSYAGGRDAKPGEAEATRELLEWLLSVPESVRCPDLE